MASRNFSMIDYFNRVAENWTPLLAFKGKTRDDWRKWRRKALRKLRELMGIWPQPAPLRAETVWKLEIEEGLTCEYVVFDSERDMSVPCYVLYPSRLKKDASNPAIICSHGHGPFGKKPVAGMRDTPELAANIEAHNYDYGLQMARSGFLTICPDLRVFGERSDARRDGSAPYPGRDNCNVQFLRGGMLGIYTLTLNVFDMMRTVDYLEARPEVDPKRIGFMGLSQGGTMTTFTAALDERIAAADIIGYVNSWRVFGTKDANFCGSQIVPEIFRWFDTSDVAGLIAPRPLLVEMGVHDKCFDFEAMRAGYCEVEKIYRAAGAGDRIDCDVHPGGHAFAGGKAFDFFAKHLRG